MAEYERDATHTNTVNLTVSNDGWRLETNGRPVAEGTSLDTFVQAVADTFNRQEAEAKALRARVIELGHKLDLLAEWDTYEYEGNHLVKGLFWSKDIATPTRESAMAELFRYLEERRARETKHAGA